MRTSVHTEPGFVRVALPAQIAGPDADLAPTQEAIDGKIEIALPHGRRVVVGKGADIAMVRQILAMLDLR